MIRKPGRGRQADGQVNGFNAVLAQLGARCKDSAIGCL